MYSRPGKTAACRRMLPPMSWAALGLACVMSTFPSRAAVAPTRPVPEAGAAAGPVLGRDPAGAKGFARSQVQESTPASSAGSLKRRGASGAATPRRNSAPAPHAAAEIARGNANRPQSMRRQEMRGRVAKSPSRAIGPTRAAATAIPASARDTTVRTLPNLKVVPRGATIGRPHVAGPGRVGGPPTGRTANFAIDGTQLHRKF
jgi:hypothetical protein